MVSFSPNHQRLLSEAAMVSGMHAAGDQRTYLLANGYSIGGHIATADNDLVRAAFGGMLQGLVDELASNLRRQIEATAAAEAESQRLAGELESARNDLAEARETAGQLMDEIGRTV